MAKQMEFFPTFFGYRETLEELRAEEVGHGGDGVSRDVFTDYLKKGGETYAAAR